MHNDHDVFIQGIHDKRRISLSFFSKEDGAILIRSCAPMDFGPSSLAKDKTDRYHFWDYESDTSPHTLSLLPNQIKSIDLTDEKFDPAEFVEWTPSWLLSRDWGIYS